MAARRALGKWHGAGIAAALMGFVSFCSGSGDLSVQFTPTTTITDCITLSQGSQYAISGYAEYEQPQLQNTTVYLNLAAPVISVRPVRQALVQVLDVQRGRVIASGMTGDNGFYNLKYNEPDGDIKVRVLARIYANDQNPRFKSDDTCNLFLSVLDNTAGAALYALTSAAVQKGTVNLNLRAAYAPARASAPFSVLDAALTSAETILAAKGDIVFKPLNLYWSTANTNVAGNVTAGLIGTSYFGQDVFASATKGAIYLLGAANVDTDEYDTNVVMHEFGHYLEYAVYRSDSVGGTHSLTALVDLSLAFSEAWGNFFSATVRQNSVYFDSSGANSAGGFYFNLENQTANNIYNETALHGALWDIADNANDGESITCTLRTFSDALLGMKTDAAATSYLSFATNLQSQSPACIAGGLTAIHANLGSGAILNSFTPTTQPSTVTGGNCRTQAYITATLPSYTDNNLLNLSFSTTGVNNYCAVKWYRLTGNGTTRTISLSAITAACNLDLYLTRGANLVAASKSTVAGGNESMTVDLANGLDYVIRVYAVTPASGTCNYTLTIS